MNKHAEYIPICSLFYYWPTHSTKLDERNNDIKRKNNLPPPANSTQTKNSLRSRNPSEILSNVYDSDNLNTSNANVVKHLYERWLI